LYDDGEVFLHTKSFIVCLEREREREKERKKERPKGKKKEKKNIDNRLTVNFKKGGNIVQSAVVVGYSLLVLLRFAIALSRHRIPSFEVNVE